MCQTLTLSTPDNHNYIWWKRGNRVKIEMIRVAQIQPRWCPYEKGPGHTEGYQGCAQPRPHEDPPAAKDLAWGKPALPPARSKTSSLQKARKLICVLKPPSLWHFAVAGVQTNLETRHWCFYPYTAVHAPPTLPLSSLPDLLRSPLTPAHTRRGNGRNRNQSSSSAGVLLPTLYLPEILSTRGKFRHS